MATDTQPPYTWNVHSLSRKLAELYASEPHLKPHWNEERPQVESRLKMLAARMQRQYADPSLLGVGGAGIVLRVTDRELGDQHCAVKFPRPVSGQTDLLTALLDKEIKHLAKLRHTSIVRIHSRGTLLAATTPPSHFPFYVMDFISGESSSKHLCSDERAVTEAELVRLVGSTLDAIAYLHQRSTAHLDIKPDNILVTADGVPIISDLGTAKRAGPGLQTAVACTFGYVHPDFAASLSSDPSDPNRVKGTLVPSHIDLKWDLYSLGRTILNWLGYDLQGKTLERSLKLTPYGRKYLLLMAARLLDGHVDQWLEDILGLTRRLLKELAYRSAQEALLDAKKLSGEFSLVDAVPELNSYHSNTLQIGAREPITYTDRLRQLVHLPPVRRLASITQLGLVNQVYPTAMHSRLEHSLGTYHNSCCFVLSLYYDPLSPLFRQVVTPRDVCLLLVSAVLHDIGQYPLAHDLEDIDSERFDHQEIGFQILALDTGKGRHSLDSVLHSWGVTRSEIVNLLKSSPERLSEPFKTRLLRSMIDGPLDADKLDYLVRDSNRLNVPYAQGIDTDRILRSLTVIVKSEGKDALACIGVHEKARVAAEFVAIARYALFSQAYWHHTVRSMKAMLSRAVWTLIAGAKDGLLERHWHKNFHKFVVGLPYGVQQEESDGDKGPPLFSLAADPKITSSKASSAEGDAPIEGDTTLGFMDAAVVHYLWTQLLQIGAPEAELLADLMSRRLYKRWLVFSKERNDGWQDIVEKWTKLEPVSRRKVNRSVEEQLAGAMNEISSGAPRISQYTLSTRQQVSLRVTANRPVILLDVPGARPGASLPLYYVVEAQRRALRKDERTVGDVHSSEVWQHFGSGLHERAGKVRIFCHPDVADILEATVDRDTFSAAFDKAVRQVTQ